MKLFNSVGNSKGNLEAYLGVAERKGRVIVWPSLLFSYPYRSGFMDLADLLYQQDLVVDEVFLDSGAFSAFTLGMEIDLEHLASWIRQVAGYDKVKCFVPTNLDVIPEPEANREQCEQCAEEGFKNYLRLKELGVESIPVLHLGESLRWLDRMLEQTDYIGLGGVTKNNIAKIRVWFDEVFPYLKRQNITGLKVHGFGATSPSILKDYPWYSVDSSTAFQMARYGQIFVPVPCVSGYDFQVYSHRKVNEWRPGLKSPMLMGDFENYLRSIGFEYEDIFDYRCRLQINVLFFRKLIDQIGDNRKTNSKQEVSCLCEEKPEQP